MVKDPTCYEKMLMDDCWTRSFILTITGNPKLYSKLFFKLCMLELLFCVKEVMFVMLEIILSDTLFT